MRVLRAPGQKSSLLPFSGKGTTPSRRFRLLLPPLFLDPPTAMPVPAPSQLPPFLSTALREKGDESDDSSAYLPSGSGLVASNTTPATPATSDLVETTLPNQPRNKSRPSKTDWTTLAASDSSTTALHSSSPLLVPPLNFDMVHSEGGSGAIYRSGHPNERNFRFMSTLNLKSIIYLSSDDIRDNLQGWIDATHGSVKLLHFRLNVNKEPFAEMDQAIVAEALQAILDRRNLPALVHCNKGKYRVGVVTALIRRLQGWSMTSVFDEYARFAGIDRVADEEVRLAANFVIRSEISSFAHLSDMACLSSSSTCFRSPSSGQKDTMRRTGWRQATPTARLR
jgi:tyrosine-protein phosphatase SIW14